MLMTSTKPLAELENASEFIARHIGIDEADEQLMLKVVESDLAVLIPKPSHLAV